ncbi:MAG: phosphoribosyltransferase [Pseudomonadota bacterium]
MRERLRTYDPAEEDTEVFRDRTEAGRKLAEALGAYRGRDVVVLALPRGGLPVAAEVARALGAPLDLLLVRKLGAPFHEELAMGAVADGEPPVTVRNPDVIGMIGVGEAGFAAVRNRELTELERRRRVYLGDRPPLSVRGRTAIVVDDGVATGATTRAALRSVRAREPSALVLATPVAPAGALESLREEADAVVCLEDLGGLGAIGAHYLDFRQLSDDEVIEILAKFPTQRA